MLPRSALLGPNLRRLPAGAAARGEIALTFDDGPNPAIGYAALLDPVLARLGPTYVSRTRRGYERITAAGLKPATLRNAHP